MPRHREVGAIELEIEAGVDDRLVFGPHRIDKSARYELCEG